MEGVEEDLNYCAALLSNVSESIQSMNSFMEKREFDQLISEIGDVILKFESLFLTLKSVKDYMEAHDV